MSERALSKTMEDAFAAMTEAGSLERLPGGFWSAPGCPRHPHNGYPIVSWGASTINALVDRGVAKFANFKEGRNFRFPINVIPTSLSHVPNPQPSGTATPATPDFPNLGVAGNLSRGRPRDRAEPPVSRRSTRKTPGMDSGGALFLGGRAANG